MDIQTRKLEFIQEFLKIQSEDVISQFEKLLKKKPETQSRMSITDLNSRIEQSESDFVHGKFKTSAELLAKYK